MRNGHASASAHRSEGFSDVKARRPQLLLLAAFAGSILASVVPIALSFQELSTLRESVRQINEASSVARQARTVGDRIAGLLSSFTAYAIGQEPAERARNLSAANVDVEAFGQSVFSLKEAMASLPAEMGDHGLSDAAAAIETLWAELRPHANPAGSKSPQQFPLLLENVRTAQAALRAIEAETVTRSDAHSKLVFEHLGVVAVLLVGAIGVGFLINSIGSLSIFHSLEKTRSANGELTRAKGDLKQRTEQLIDAHRLGKLGDWQFAVAERKFLLAAETYRLLGLEPATFQATYENITGLLVDTDLQRVLDAHSQVSDTGEPTSVDVKIRRADGSIGDFTLTSKALRGPGGRIVSYFGTLQDISERKAAEEQLEAIAYYDPLTGLANRALFSRRLGEMLNRAAQRNHSSALLLLDLDRFKEVNDTLGHAAGDELLVRVGHRISRVLGNRHFLARLGGDEFAILVEEQPGPAALERLAREIIAVVSESIMLERGEVCVGTSIGIVIAPERGGNASDLLRNADLALYRAKEDGRGRFAFFTSDMDTAVQHKMALAKDLRRAIATSCGLSVHYQPQIELASGRVVGFEALLRWTHPERGEVSPAEFVPIAESSSLICDLGNWILREAAMQAKAWLDSGATPREVSVNVSAAQIWHSDLVGEVGRVLADSGLPPHLLCLELTESLMADHSEGRVRTALKALKGLGVTLALDDFGTDYSSLGYLAQLPIDKLKIDRVFVHGVAVSHRSRELLKGIIALGRGLGMTVIAEGAEKRDEIEFLHEAGCDQVQGHVFSRAISATAALDFAGESERVNGLAARAPVRDETELMVKQLRAAVA